MSPPSTAQLAGMAGLWLRMLDGHSGPGRTFTAHATSPATYSLARTTAAAGAPLRAAAVGRRLQKRFGGELYGGVVAEFLPARRWYLVQYDDGDAEDLAWEDLRALLLPLPSPERPRGAEDGDGGTVGAVPPGE